MDSEIPLLIMALHAWHLR